MVNAPSRTVFYHEFRTWILYGHERTRTDTLRVRYWVVPLIAQLGYNGPALTPLGRLRPPPGGWLPILLRLTYEKAPEHSGAFSFGPPPLKKEQIFYSIPGRVGYGWGGD